MQHAVFIIQATRAISISTPDKYKLNADCHAYISESMQRLHELEPKKLVKLFQSIEESKLNPDPTGEAGQHKTSHLQMLVGEILRRAPDFNYNSVISIIHTFHSFQKSRRLGMYFNSKLMKILLDADIQKDIPMMQKMQLSILAKVMSQNGFGYLPYMEAINRRFVRLEKDLDILDCNIMINSMLRVDRVGISTLAVFEEKVDQFINELRELKYLNKEHTYNSINVAHQLLVLEKFPQLKDLL